jgi:hypothetical protein
LCIKYFPPLPKEKDSEIVFLRETMEQNEQVIFRVYEEKEKMWERELKKMKNLYEARLKANQQKASKMEAVLLNQTYQVTRTQGASVVLETCLAVPYMLIC